MSKVQPIPTDRAHVIPHLTVQNCPQAMEFYKKAFGAVELSRQKMPDGVIIHAAMKIGEGVIFLNEEIKQMDALSPKTVGGTPVCLMFYTQDVDAVFKRAIDAGATTKLEVSDQFWGDRYGVLTDPYGHQWEIATHKEDVSPEEMERRGREMMQQAKR